MHKGCKRRGRMGHLARAKTGVGARQLKSWRANFDLASKKLASTQKTHILGCSVLGPGAEPLVRTQFLEHPPTLNFGANHLKKWIRHPQKPPIPFLSPHNPHRRGGFWGGVKQLEHS